MSGEPYRPPLIILQMIWNSVTLLLGILGNSFMFYSTIRHKALKMDIMSVWITNNVSVADLLNCIFVLLPTLTTQFIGHWIFGESFWFVHFAWRYSFFVANILLLNLLSLNKLLRCLFPLRTLSSSRKQRLVVTMATVIWSVIPICWTLVLWSMGYMTADVDSRNMGAFRIGNTWLKETQYTGLIRKVLMGLALMTGTLCLTMAVSTTVILVYAVKMTNRPVVKKNIFTVIAICIVFLLTYLPGCIWYAIQSWDAVLAEFLWSVSFLSVWINPFIHFIGNQSFRKFTVNTVCCRKTRVVFPVQDHSSHSSNIRGC